jgi:CheY-like chemotaxis protein
MNQDDKKLQWISDWGSLPQKSGVIESKAVVPLAEKAAKGDAKTAQSLVQVLRKIPLLLGLSPSQIHKLLSICEPQTRSPGDFLLQSGQTSTSMFILLAGELAVITQEGLNVAQIEPVTTVGEMGIIVRHPSSVSVEAVRPSQILALNKERFDAVLREDREMQTLVYRNLIATLSSRLLHGNIRRRDHLLERESYEARLRAAERRLQLALDIVEQHQVMPAIEAVEWIDARLQDTTPHVLVVDDEADIRQLIIKVLSDFVVLEAANGHEALEIAQRERLNLVITDIRMPKMDGLTLLGHLKDEYPEIPVLGISGYIDSETVKERGFNGFLEKPMALARLKTMVQDHLN